MRIDTSPFIKANGEQYAIQFDSTERVHQYLKTISDLPDVSFSVEDVFTKHILQIVSPKNSYIVGSENGRAYTSQEDAIQDFLEENLERMEKVINDVYHYIYILNKRTPFWMKPFSSYYKEKLAKFHKNIHILTETRKTLEDMREDSEHPLREKIPIIPAPEYVDVDDSVLDSFFVDKKLYYFKFERNKSSVDFQECSVRLTGFDEGYEPRFELFNVNEGHSIIEMRGRAPSNINGIIKISGLTTNHVVFESKEVALKYLFSKKEQFETAISNIENIMQDIS